MTDGELICVFLRVGQVMVNQALFGISFLAVVISFAPQPSQAQARIPIVWGIDETLYEVDELPEDVAETIKEELAAEVSIGFLYQRFHIFWLDLWTWNGRYVLCEGEKYWDLESDDWNKIIGTQPMAMYGKPMSYRLPFGLVGLVCLCVFGFLGKRLWKTDRAKVKDLLKDRHYQIAAEMLDVPHQASANNSTNFNADDLRFREAVKLLVKQGTSPVEAEANLKLIAEVISADQEEQLEDQFALASRLEQAGEWDKSIELYTSLLEKLPESDERRGYAENCIASVKQKVASP